MKLADIQTKKAAVRAQLEELLTLAGSRAFSTEENQRFTDLKAEAESLTALESRYSILETLDKKPTTVIPTVAPRTQSTKQQMYAALDSFLRNPNGIQAVDTPLQIQQSPVEAGLAAAVPSEVVAEAVSLCGAVDLPSALGVRDFPRTSTNPLTVPFEIAEATVNTRNEAAATSESAPGDYDSVTLSGVCYDVKVSIESLANVAFNLSQSVTRTIALGQIIKQNAAFAAALKAAVQANADDCFVDIFTGGADVHTALTRLIAGLDPIFGNGVFLLNQSDFQKIQDGRPTSGDGHPLVNTDNGTILNKKYVVSNDVDRLYYGSWNLGAYRSQSPLTLQTLRELYSEKRMVGYKGYQFADFKFAASTAATKQPIKFGHLSVAGS